MSGLYFIYLIVTCICLRTVEDNIELPQKYHTYLASYLSYRFPFREKAVLVIICSLKGSIISPLNPVIAV